MLAGIALIATLATGALAVEDTPTQAHAVLYDTSKAAAAQFVTLMNVSNSKFHPVQDLFSRRPVEGMVSSRFGMRKLSIEPRKRMHNGVDIHAKRGTVVVAPGPGKVSFVGTAGTYGKMVEIIHGQGVITRYAHLHTHTVKRGQIVQPGTKLGTVGSTGRATGPNLHFEVIIEHEHIDPLQVIPYPCCKKTMA